MRAYPFLITPLLLAAAGCNRFPESYPPPEQRKPLAGSEPQWIGHFVNMSDPTAESYLVKDVNKALEGNWRWAHRRPELRFYLDSTEHLKFVMDFGIPETIVNEVGPLTFSYFINDQLLAKVVYKKAGEQHFEQAVPPALLKAHAVNRVTIQPDKVWTSKADGVELTFILMRAGFVE